MKLTTHTFVSLDGVMQGPGGPDEDTTGGFRHGGWVAPYLDEEGGEVVTDWMTRTSALLLGRTTYDLFSDYWPRVTDPDNPVATTFNTVPKHVVSTTLTDPTWAGTSVISGDEESVVGQISALKASTADGELQVHGSAGLLRTLHDAGLVDEYRIVVFPVVLGQGKRLFADGVAPAAFSMESRSIGNGLTLLTLRPAGSLRLGGYEVVDGKDTATGETPAPLS